MSDKYGRPLPKCIPQEIHDQVIKALDTDRYVAYNHWLAAGATIDVLNDKLVDTTAPDDNNFVFGDKTVTKFLWKPVADSRGGVLVILVSPDLKPVISGARITLERGATNGYSNTWYFNVPGDKLGKNIKIEFIDNNGKLARISPKLKQIFRPGTTSSKYTLYEDCIVIADGGGRVQLA